MSNHTADQDAQDDLLKIQKRTQELVARRKARGARIARSGRLERLSDDLWVVSSESSREKYRVDLAEKAEQPCSCDDYDLHRAWCKHIYAALYARNNNLGAASGATTEAAVVPAEQASALKRKNYGQDWEAYDKAQANEKDVFQVLLGHLCSTVAQPAQSNGRPYLPLANTLPSAIGTETPDGLERDRGGPGPGWRRGSGANTRWRSGRPFSRTYDGSA